MAFSSNEKGVIFPEGEGHNTETLAFEPCNPCNLHSTVFPNLDFHVKNHVSFVLCFIFFRNLNPHSTLPSFMVGIDRPIARSIKSLPQTGALIKS